MTVWHLFIANLKMIFRNRQALFWALVFPLIFVVVFGVFRLDEPPTTKLAVVDQAQNLVSRELVNGLQDLPYLELDESLTAAEARQALEQGSIDYALFVPAGVGAALVPGAPAAELVLFYDQTDIRNGQRMFAMINGFVDKANLALNQAREVVTLKGEAVQTRQLSYFDFLLPGFVGMGVMTYAIIGIASVLAFYRQQKILKRMLATPLSVGKFFTGLILAHLVLALVQAAIILSAGILLFGAHLYGNLLWVAMLIILANIVFLSIGFIVGSFSKSPEAANGIANAVTMPMMFFSGVFFPIDSLPTVIRAVVVYFPLTPLLEGLRGVILDAKPIWDFPTQIVILVMWVMVTSIAAIRLFRFS
jgi:ABC-2 type transport system permease protein